MQQELEAIPGYIARYVQKKGQDNQRVGAVFAPECLGGSGQEPCLETLASYLLHQRRNISTENGFSVYDAVRQYC